MMGSFGPGHDREPGITPVPGQLPPQFTEFMVESAAMHSDGWQVAPSTDPLPPCSSGSVEAAMHDSQVAWLVTTTPGNWDDVVYLEGIVAPCWVATDRAEVRAGEELAAYLLPSA